MMYGPTVVPTFRAGGETAAVVAQPFRAARQSRPEGLRYRRFLHRLFRRTVSVRRRQSAGGPVSLRATQDDVSNWFGTPLLVSRSRRVLVLPRDVRAPGHTHESKSADQKRQV